MDTQTMTSITTDPADGATHPWDVCVGDPVHFWREGAPPLSQEYVAPECWHALVLGFSYDDQSVWRADLAVVDPSDGSLRIERGVLFSPSSVRIGQHGGLSEPSWGAVQSWHRTLAHKGGEHS